jgi:hypothetical protein
MVRHPIFIFPHACIFFFMNNNFIERKGYRKYRNKEIPRSNYQKIEWAKNNLNASLCFVALVHE